MRTYKQIVQTVYGEHHQPFWSGFASALDLFHTPKKHTSPRRRMRSEAEAFREDWANVSGDLERAFDRARCR